MFGLLRRSDRDFLKSCWTKASTTTPRATVIPPPIRLALRYSELMATDPDAVDAAFFDELRKYYSEEEIVELGLFIGFNLGYHTFFGTLKFYPLFSPDGRLLTQEESESFTARRRPRSVRRPQNDPHRTAAARGNHRPRNARTDRAIARNWVYRTICFRALWRARPIRRSRSCARC